ncbi:MAG: Ppx/GppA family phosphatase [Actinobacteria bacterium]|nr:Ppx/GppA family phosphatase [Actinomycetota bacterium]
MVKSVIDVGTNSTRLLVAKVSDGKVSEIVRLTKITRLGDKLNATGRISIESAKRTADVINDYLNIAKKENAKVIGVFGTQALREASNRDEILDYFESATGKQVKVISGEEEAIYSFKGATLELGDKKKVVVDIGGGSTEIAFGAGQPESVVSTDLGCVRFTEKYGLVNRVSKDKAEEIVKEIENQLRLSFSKKNLSDYQAVFLGGTATTLAAIALGLEKYDRKKVHLTSISRSTIENIAFELSLLDAKERSKFKVIEKERLEVIAAGALILLGIINVFEIENIIVSETDLLDGLLVFAV